MRTEEEIRKRLLSDGAHIDEAVSFGEALMQRKLSPEAHEGVVSFLLGYEAAILEWVLE